MYTRADSSGIDPGLYQYMRDQVGHVDIAFLGMDTLSGSNAAQAAAIMTELGAGEAYVYAMGEETWLVGHVMATTYNEAYHLYGQHERLW
jgi:hypothetical protein